MEYTGAPRPVTASQPEPGSETLTAATRPTTLTDAVLCRYVITRRDVLERPRHVGRHVVQQRVEEAEGAAACVEADLVELSDQRGEEGGRQGSASNDSEDSPYHDGYPRAPHGDIGYSPRH